MSDDMTGSSTSPPGGSQESGEEQSSPQSNVQEQDRYLPIANISRIMKKALPSNGKVAMDAKYSVQECVSEFISFITSEASDKCRKEKRETINGDDLLWAMATLGFEDYMEPLELYLARYRELEGDTKGSVLGGDGGDDGSFKRDAVGALAAQYPHQAQGQHMIISSMQDNEFFWDMADDMTGSSTSPPGESQESSEEQSSPQSNVREQDRYLPIVNISRIMKKALPSNGKVAMDAKYSVQECVSEFISFITSEACDKCRKEKRKTIDGDDLLWAMETLGFEDYMEPLKLYLAKYRELEGDTKGSVRGDDGSFNRDAVGALAAQNPHQAQGQHMITPSMQGNE